MTFANNNDWQIAAGVTTVAAIASLAIWLVMRRRPTAEEMERARRQFLVQSGRLVDGMLLDVYEVDGAAGQKLTFLLFNYRIGGVDYECSQKLPPCAASSRPAKCAPDSPAPCVTSPATRTTAS